MAFSSTDWSPLLVEFEYAVASDVGAATLFDRFEAALDRRLVEVTGRSPPPAGVGKRRQTTLNPTRALLRRQPWFDGECAAARAAWRRLRWLQAPTTEISRARS